MLSQLVISRVTWHSCPAAFWTPWEAFQPEHVCPAQLLEQGYRTWNISKYFSISHNKGESNSLKARERKLLTIKWLVKKRWFIKQSCHIKFHALFCFFRCVWGSVLFFLLPETAVLGCCKEGHWLPQNGFPFCSVCALPGQPSSSFCLSVLPPLKEACLSEGLSFIS